MQALAVLESDDLVDADLGFFNHTAVHGCVLIDQLLEFGRAAAHGCKAQLCQLALDFGGSDGLCNGL